MAEYLIQDTTLTGIADAIRVKTDKSDSIFVSDMANEILSIPSNVTDGELNFKVVGGTTEPTDPKENTIWIDTSTPVNCYDFSVNEPYRRSGTKNLIVYPYSHTTQTTNGITFTDNGDGTIKVNGTATADAYFRCSVSGSTVDTNQIQLEPGTYTLSDVNGNANCRIEAGISYDNGTNYSFFTCNNGPTIITVTARAIVRFSIMVKSGAVISNVVLKPQLERGSVATEFVKGDADGQVWFLTGTSSTASFNALKKNGIQVYPISAKQYINGAWVDKTAKSYQNGGWVDWIPPDIYLVKNGKLNATLKKYSSSGASMTSTEHTDGYVVLYGSKDGFHAWYDAVDLTAYKSLSVKTTASSASQGTNTLCVWPLTQTTPQYDNASAKVQLQGSGTSTVDVSSFEGDYFVGVTSTTTLQVKIVNWWIGQ